MAEHWNWSSKTIFLSGVTGSEIAKKNDELNSKPHIVVIATQIQPVNTGSDLRVYDCWVYYKDKFGNIKLPQK